MPKFQIEIFKNNSLEPEHTTVIYAPNMEAAEKTAEAMRKSYEGTNYNVTERPERSLAFEIAKGLNTGK